MLISGQPKEKSSAEAVKIACYEAITANAGIGYAVGDKLVKIYNYDATLGILNATTPFTWINATTDTVLTGVPVPAEIKKCPVNTFDTETEKKYVTDTVTGEIKYVREIVLYDSEGAVVGTPYYTTTLGVTYVLGGDEVAGDEPVRVSLGGEVVAVVDTAVSTLTVPVNTAGVYIDVHEGNDIKVTNTGTDPDTGLIGVGTLVREEQKIILHSAIEANNFKAIATSNVAPAEIYVEYFNTSIETGV